MIEQSPRLSSRVSMLRQFASGVVLTLFLLRYFDVAESAGQGETLWIVALWFVALLVWGIAAACSPRQTVSFGWLDLFVGLLAASHVISALVIVGTSGDKRSAINLAWEWVGIVVAWFLLRYECRQISFRRDLLVGLIAAGTAVAGLGLYQHYVDFPALAKKYGPLFDQLRVADPIEAERIRNILAADQIPMDEAGMILFEKRLRDSREPLGLFALANTLGGFLAVCLILTIGFAPANFANHGSVGWKRLLPWLFVIGILGATLLLTKSRTAWVGTAAGLAIWSACSMRLSLTWNRLAAVAGALALLVLTVLGLGRLGGLDRQVLTEAPKSLQYRLQYWTATWPMIKDHFWLGVGPGQFRSHYLLYKLPEASEEIADPHNLLLDVFANGGLVAVVALLGLFVILVIKMRRPAVQLDRPTTLTTNSAIPIVVTGLTAIGWCVSLLTSYDDRLLVLLPVAVVLFWSLRRIVGVDSETGSVFRIAALGAVTALFVHLLGAGGIGMPAVILLLLALTAVAAGGELTSPTGAVGVSLKCCVVICSVSMVLSVALYTTAIGPVAAVQSRLRAGDKLWQKGSAEGADAEYRLAAAADRMASEPLRKRAELAYALAERDRFRSNDSFLNAVHLMREAIARDPTAYQDDRRLGDWWLSRWKVTHDLKDAQEAVAAFEAASARYPTNSLLLADLAFAYVAAGSAQTAGVVAGKAIIQDNINRDRQHVDRILAQPVRKRLETLSADQAGSSGDG